MDALDHEQLMLCISHGYTSLHRHRYSIYPIDIDTHEQHRSKQSHRPGQQGHRGGRGTPTIHHACVGGGVGVATLYHIYIYFIIFL